MSCTHFTASAISATQMNINGVSGTGTFNGSVLTSGGITLSGAAFAINASMTTIGGGALSITDTISLTILPSVTLDLTGSFTQTGIGTSNLGGNYFTNGNSMQFAGPINLIGSLALDSAGGNVTISDDLNGPYAFSITAGSGDVVIPMTISDESALQSFIIHSAHDISLNGIGLSNEIMPGPLNLTASHVITLAGFFYSAHSHIYSAGVSTDFVEPGFMTLLSTGGNIGLGAGSLADGTNLLVTTNGGDFAYNTIGATFFENITIDAGVGLVTMGSLPTLGAINTVTVNGGSIVFNGPMDLVNGSFVSNTSIFNASAPVNITAANTVFFNAIHGDVGTLASPILVNTQQQIIAGGIDLASFNGSSIDNTVHEYPPNPPCDIYFNGVQIKSCIRPPPPPPPPPPPGPPPSPPTPDLKGSRFFAVQGMYDSQFTLANDYFFFIFFLNERYWHRSVPVFASTGK